jgi:hypothetical protein
MLRFKTRISKKLALEKVCAHAVAGKHNHQPRPRIEQDVKFFFATRGVDLSDIAERCRDPNQHVPLFENLIGPTWALHGSGGASLVDREGNEVASIKGSGELVQSTYWALFEHACLARDRAVAGSSYLDFQTAIVSGIASIEAFINVLAEIWNARNAEDLLVDSKANKVSFDDKIDQWIPKIIGNVFDKSDRRWCNFVELRRIRDHLTIHPKVDAYGLEEGELANKINLFRYGIAGFLGKLHILSGQQVPAIIINAVYMPEVEVV